MESNTTSITRSLSKVKSKISSKFRSDSVSQDDDHVLKAMRYDDTLPASSSGASSVCTSGASLSSTSSTSSTLPPSSSSSSSSLSSMISQRQNSTQESRSSSVVQMESIPESEAVLVALPTHQRSTSQSTIHSGLLPVTSPTTTQGTTTPTSVSLATTPVNSTSSSVLVTTPGTATSSSSSSSTSSEPVSLLALRVNSIHADTGTSLQSFRKTSLDDKQEDQLLEQLLPPPPMLSSVSPQITTSLSSPFGRLSPPMSPMADKLRSVSVSCDPLENTVGVLSSNGTNGGDSISSSSNPNDFADAMALSILDKIDESNDSNTEWKI